PAMLKFKCPECTHEISLKEPKEGRFQPACPKCAKKFGLEILGGNARIVKLAVAAAHVVKAATVVEEHATALHASEIGGGVDATAIHTSAAGSGTSEAEKTGAWQDQATAVGSADRTGAFEESKPAKVS